MHRQHVLWHQPSVWDVTAYSSSEEFDWGSVDGAKETDEIDVDSDGSSSKPSADAVMVKQTKVSTTSH